MSKLRGLERRANKGKSRVKLNIERKIKVKNGYLDVKFPLTAAQAETLDLFTDYMMSFVYGDRSMDNTEDAEEWAVKVKMYLGGLFGETAYYKCFGNSIATHEEIGELFEQLNNLVVECRKDVRQLQDLISDCKRRMNIATKR